MRRAYIQASKASVKDLALELGVTEDSIRRWKKRDTVEDRSHTPHRLQTTLNEAQQAIVVELRKTLRLSLDDLLVMPREFIHEGTSRSGLQRLLVRKGQSRLPREETANRTHQPFKSYAPGFVHVDVKYLPQMGNETQRRYLFVAIPLGVYPDQVAQDRRGTPQLCGSAAQGCPIRITPILSDNAKEFTDRLFGGRQRHATGGTCTANP